MSTESISRFADQTAGFAQVILAEQGAPGSKAAGRVQSALRGTAGAAEFLAAVDSDLRRGDVGLRGSMKWLLAEAGKTGVLAGLGMGAAALAGISISAPAAVAAAGLAVAGVDCSGLASGAWKLLDRGVHSVTDRFVDFFEPANLRRFKDRIFSFF